MRRTGDNPNSLAAKVKHQTKQPQIYKFLAGISREPKRSTLQPIADFYKVDVEAFYNPSKADEALKKLDEWTESDHKDANARLENESASDLHLNNPERHQANAALSQQDPQELLIQLGAILGALDPITRSQTGPILAQLEKTPELASELGARLKATISMGTQTPFVPFNPFPKKP